MLETNKLDNHIDVQTIDYFLFILTFRISPTRESRLLIFSTTRGSNTTGRASKCSDPHEVGAAAVDEEDERDDDEEEDLGG